ncbi:MAG: HDIG domain-containing protein [Phycisphaerales bacterium]|nr:HDIG domain-containing protein [Phycisphaerales bacterium]
MPKETTKTASKPAPKTGQGTPRRVVVRIGDRSLRHRIADWIASPNLFWGVVVFTIFVLLVGVVTIWTRSQPLVAVDQIVRQTRISRVEFSAEDLQQTDRLKEDARQNVPRVYAADLPVLEDIRASLANLPRTLAGVEEFDKVDANIRREFGLSEPAFAALVAVNNDETAAAAFNASVQSLDGMLRRRPMMDRQTWQRATQEGRNPQIELRYGPAEEHIADPLRVSRNDAVNIENAEQFGVEVARIIEIAGFTDPIASIVRERLMRNARPTFTADSGATIVSQNMAADQILPVRRVITVGQRLYARGDILEQSALELARQETREFHRQGKLSRRVLRWISIFGFIGALAIGLGGYIMVYCPKIALRPARFGWMAALMIIAVYGASLLGANDPRLMWLSAITPVVLVAVLVCVAYDQRTALIVSTVTAILIAMSLRLETSMVIIMFVGIGFAVAQLREIRERRTLIRMSIVTALALAVATVFGQLIDLPTVGAGGTAIIGAVLFAGLQAMMAGLVVGGIALFILPFIERVFDITTGMTLIELRDPKQPILRELQQRAPGTYNHSLNVASIAESAAESIGADALLTYVGCLYHDIGKMNKPGYFIENQSGGRNKHDKLTPAMSLLIIIGHVKDGMEMAQEHGLPKALRHFIEAHHGTTLVEYFYHRAREQASGEGEQRTAEQILKDNAEQLPDEVDYRYPGPKPRTKEVAITMLSDAVESATRTLAEPTPARIDALVRTLANKRMSDGQFDECDLTFRELSTICESISKTVASIYHGRIRYASTDTEKGKDKPKPKPEAVKPEPAAPNGGQEAEGEPNS